MPDEHIEIRRFDKMATIYNKTFVKKDGQKRDIKFIRLSELTKEDYETFGVPPPSGSAPRKLSEGNELVWDVEVNNFRIFNWLQEVK